MIRFITSNKQMNNLNLKKQNMKTNQLIHNRMSVLFYTTAVLLLFSFSGKAQLALDANNNIGIGTSSPDIYGIGSAFKTLTILGPNTTPASCGIVEMATQSTDADNNVSGVLNFVASANSAGKRSVAQIVGYTQGSTSTNRGGTMVFSTKPDGSSFVLQRMVIDNAGNVGIGTSSPTSILHTIAAGAKTAAYSGNLLTNTATSSTASITKAGLELKSTGTWNGTSAKNIGLYVSSVTGGTNNYDAIFNGGGSVGIGTTGPTALLEINGTAKCNANAWTVSDQQFKTNVDSLLNALATIKQLKPKSYFFDTLNQKGFNFPSEKQIGFIAQDVEQVLPNLVQTSVRKEVVDSSGNVIYPSITYKALSYTSLIPLLTKGIQELQFKNDSLQTKINNQDSINAAVQNQLSQLLDQINGCCSIGGTRSKQTAANDAQSLGQTNVKLTDTQSIILEQNSPNPFNEQTTINYYLPDGTGKAQLLFYNAQGRLIQSTDLIQKGKGTVNVFASDLSNGVYTYTLVVDGKIIETKKMVKN
jgi:hypothetical protein